MKYLFESYSDFLNERNNIQNTRDEIAQEEFGMDYNQLGLGEKEWVDDEIENRGLNESVSNDIRHALKSVKDYNRSRQTDRDFKNLIDNIISNLGFEDTKSNYDKVSDHIINSIEYDDVPEDKDLMRELYSIVESNLISEARVKYKRKYTEKYPAKTFNSNTKIRTKVLSSMSDKTLTEDELKGLLKELNANPRWFKRNSNLFKITENGICLSKTGKRMAKHIVKPINEEPEDKTVTESVVTNTSDAVDYIIKNYRKITGSKYNRNEVPEEDIPKIERFLKKNRINVDEFWATWLKYSL